MRRVTVKWLMDNKACEEQIEAFESEWPDGTDLTPEAIRRAAELELDLEWFGMTYLRSDGVKRETFTRAANKAERAWDEADAKARGERQLPSTPESHSAYLSALGANHVAHHKSVAEALTKVLEE